MAARSVLKFLTQTCYFSLNATCPSALSPLSTDKCYRRPQRSYSQPPQKQCRRTRKANAFQLRKLSKSLQTLRESRYKDESYEEHEAEEEHKPSSHHNTFPPASDLNVRETAKEFKEKHAAEEKNEEGNAIYELAEGTRSEENYYDVLGYMKKAEGEKMRRVFPHLQPNNLRPYGSNDNLFYPALRKRNIKIVYPVTNTASQSDTSKNKKFDKIQYKEFSSYRVPKKENPGYEETKKVAVCEKSSSRVINKKNYSTTCTTANKNLTNQIVDTKAPKLTVSTSFTRKSSTALIKRKKDPKTQIDAIIKSSIGMLDQFYKKLEETKAKRKNRENFLSSESFNEKFLDHTKKPMSEPNRRYNTYNKPADINCDDYVTIKLSELQEECRKVKKCRPKKISFGRLPKLVPPDCPCIEDIPLKEGKPLLRLKKRDVKAPEQICEDHFKCTTPRADANYKIKPKTLPVIKAQECPCKEREMTDLVIRRLPKKKIPEPPKICVKCVGEECCPPRADGQLKIEKKVLPKLQINNCPCKEDIPMKSVPLHRLKPMKIKEPERICPEKDKCNEAERADHNLVVEKKVLPVIKSECVCVEPPPMDEVPPLKRLPKVHYEEKPRGPCEEEECADAVRADKDLKFGSKKLPVFVPRTCPCIEKEIPDVVVKLKRLKMRSIPKEKEKICEGVEVCVRADDGLEVKPKQLPVIHPKECPCIPIEMVDVPPLKKLVPKPVEEPPKVCKREEECTMPRADANLQVKQKTLPRLPPGACPCIEPEPPLDVKPLRKLKKKPILPKRLCPVKEDECAERADEHLKVKIKRLPKLDVPDCPCIEPPPPEDVRPLKRLKKVFVPEPQRICPRLDDCEDIPRADKDDWLYWRRVEVKHASYEPVKTARRNLSVLSSRRYGTSIKKDVDLFQLKYDVPRLAASQFSAKSYNIIIDIKPSAPLILTQKPLELSKKDSFDGGLCRNKLKRSKSEPVDCVTFVIFKSNSFGTTKSTKEGSSDISLVFNSINRFISTCSTLYEYSERSKDKLKDHTTPLCECPKDDKHLQPRNPIIPEKESFIKPFPTDDDIDISAKKSRLYYRTRKDEMDCNEQDREDDECQGEQQDLPKNLCEIKDEAMAEKKLSLWERIVNYFRARPGCPTPEEFKRIRLKEDAERAASKAGLCLYDPKEMLRKNEKELPKVITADAVKEECQK